MEKDSAQLSDVDEPPESDGPVLVETIAVGICGTDIEILSGAYGWAPPGRERLVLGHESLGRVLEAPAGAPVAEGDLVVGIVRRPDPVPCANCAVGEWDFCRNGQYTERGIKEHDGYLSERYRITPDYLVKVDPSLGILGVLLEPTRVVAKAWEQVDRIGGRAHWDPDPGRGHRGRAHRPAGRHDRGPAGPGGPRHRPDDRRASSPTWCADWERTTTRARWPRRATTPDAIIECTGVSSLVLDAMEHVGPGGVVCLTGVSAAGRAIEVDEGALNRSMVLANESVVGSVNANRRHYEAAAAALAKADRGWLSGGGQPEGPPGRLGAGAGPPARRREGGGGGLRPLSGSARRIAPGVLEIDTLLGGWHRVTAGYLIEGPTPVLVETGSQSSVPVLLEALADLGMGAGDLAGVVVTHIHLDHAGGVGDVARAFPSATVYVHEKGARHLADPTRLVESAARVYGPLLDSLYGRLEPTPAERLHVLDDGEEIRGRARPGAGGGGLPGPRQAPRGAARLGQRDPVRRRRRGGPAARRRGAPALDAAAGLRPRPGAALAPPVRRTTADGHRPGPLRPAPRPSRPPGRGRGDPPARGPRRPSAPSPRGATSPMPWPSGSTRRWPMWPPSTARSSRS